MPKPALRLVLVLASTALSCALLVPLYLSWRNSRSEVVSFRRSAGGATPALPGIGAFASAEDDRSLPSVLEVERPRFPPSAFARVPLAPSEVARLLPVNRTLVYDAHAHYRRASSLDSEGPWEEHPRGRIRTRTNALGLREDGELRAGPFDLRVLVAGDSHTDGVCENAESYVNLLEADLGARHPLRRVDCVNHGQGGYSFHQYLGSLERMLPARPDVFVVTVYGGNDFEEVLTLAHRFRGTVRPPGSVGYGPQLEAAFEVFPASLPQAFLSLKYFAANPGEAEVALQAARDVCAEIAALCLRRSIRAVFVYLPPPTDVEWELHAEVFDGMRDALELAPADLARPDRMADSLIAYLRESGLETLDLRPAFRAAEVPLFWRQDMHLNLEGHRIVARELAPLFEDDLARPRQRTRRAPGSPGGEHAEAGLLAPGAPGPELVAQSGVHLAEALLSGASVSGDLGFELASASEQTARALHAFGPADEYDPQSFLRYRAGLDTQREGGGRVWPLRTNARGLRGVADPAAGCDLRVLAVGGPVFDGPDEEESGIPALVAAELARLRPDLAVEACNAAHERHSFRESAGAARARRLLVPQVVLYAADGDAFGAAVETERILAGAPVPPALRERLRARITEAGLPRDLERAAAQVEIFRVLPWEAEGALRIALGATLDVAHSAELAGARTLVLYVPPTSLTSRERADALLELGAPFGWTRDDIELPGRIGELYLEALVARGVEVVDATGPLRALVQGALDGGSPSEHARRALAREVARRIADAPAPSAR